MKNIFQFLTRFPSTYNDIFVIVTSYAIFAIGAAVYWAAIPIFARDIFELTPFWVGFLVASIGFIYVVTDIPTGVVLDYIGYKTGAALGITSALITAILSIITESFPLFIVGLIFYALAWNTITYAVSAYILYSIPNNDEGKVFGLYGSLYTLGVFIATLFIGRIPEWGLETVGWFFLVPTAISLWLVLFFLKSENRKYDHNIWHAFKKYYQSSSTWTRGMKAMEEMKPVSYLVACNGFVRFTFSSTIWFVIPLSLSLFANPFLPEGFALGVFEIGGIFTIVGAGFLADRYSKKKIFLNFLLFCSIGTLILGFIDDHFLLFLGMAFVTMIAYDTVGPAADAMLAIADVKHDKDGTIYGFIGTLSDSGIIVGPLVSGAIFELFGLREVFIFLAVLLFIDWLIARILLKNFIENRSALAPAHRKFHLGGSCKNC